MKNNSRRSFIKKIALSAGALSAVNLNAMNLLNRQVDDIDNQDSSSGNGIKIAGYPVNRLKAMVKGEVEIEGFNYSFKKGSIGDLNSDTFNGEQSYDITEIGLHPYMLAYANEGFRDYSLIPVFPVRVFRHKSVFINTKKNIKRAQDIKGKRVGTAGYSSTSLTWLRGIFEDEYGIKPTDVTWVISRKDSSKSTAGNISKQEQQLPEGIKVEYGTLGKDESDLLVSGEVDALFHAAEPKAYIEGNPLVDRLFPDFRSVETDYYSRTGIFPIMHAVAIKNTCVEENPNIVEAVFKAYSQAKQMDYDYMQKWAWAFESLPWFTQEYINTKELMGENFWPYGLKRNRIVLEKLFQYSYKQGMTNKHLKIEDVFHPLALELEENI